MRDPESVPVAVLILESWLKMAAEGESLDLATRKQQGKLDKDEEKFLKKLIKALGYRQENPRHNSLASHEIDDLTRIHGLKIFQSYLENNTPSAGRLFWAYGPDKGGHHRAGHRAAPGGSEARCLPTYQAV